MRRFLFPIFCIAIVTGAVLSAQVSPTSSASTVEQQQAVKGSNSFATDLYGQLRKEPGNLFFSPESISTVFAMAQAGARGETAKQIATVFHFSLPPERLQPTMGALLSGLNAEHTDFELHVADGLWGQKDEGFRESFLSELRTNYGVELHQVDFRSSPDVVRGEINHWIEKQTHDRIKDMLARGTITPATRLVLTNAIYFKGAWVAPFRESMTKPGPFQVTGSATVQAPFMHRTGAYEFYDGGTFQALEMPYKGGDLAMVILLPKDVDGLSALESSLTEDALERWIGQFAYASKVILSMPRFTMTQQFALGKTLSAMGMPLAFSDGADFSGMTGKEGLSISEAIHKAFVDVNETGTEAAAATAGVFSATAARIEPPPVVFNADHPFLFLIRDTKSGSILFLGRVADPTK